MKKIISIILTIFTIGTLVSCGFNEDAAKEESKTQLEDFFALYENGEEVISYEDSESIEAFNSFIESNSDYLTEQFISDTETNNLEDTYISGYYIFYLLKYSDTGYQFFNEYQIDFISMDTENESVTYLLTGISSNRNLNEKYEITMIKEDGKWKVDSVEHL